MYCGAPFATISEMARGTPHARKHRERRGLVEGPAKGFPEGSILRNVENCLLRVAEGRMGESIETRRVGSIFMKRRAKHPENERLEAAKAAREAGKCFAASARDARYALKSSLEHCAGVAFALAALLDPAPAQGCVRMRAGKVNEIAGDHFFAAMETGPQPWRAAEYARRQFERAKELGGDAFVLDAKISACGKMAKELRDLRNDLRMMDLY